MRLTTIFFLFFFLSFGSGYAQESKSDQIDWKRAQEIRQKEQAGKTITKEERAYLERAEEAYRKGKRPPANLKVNQAKPSLDLKPLSDMTSRDKYKGEDGGLYGGGKNAPPKQHLQAALQQAKLIQPLDSQGKPAENGKIVLISLGMSNTTQEFSQFIKVAEKDSVKSPKLVLVDGAQGSMTANSWANAEHSAGSDARTPWEVLNERLKHAGVTAEQVQVVWIKQAMAQPAALGEFPKHVEDLKRHLVTILQKLKERFPNLHLVYLSSRIYAGYASTALNPEPFAYESAFAVRWLIQEQIKGEASLNYDSSKGTVKSPLLLWGPYLWANGEKGRKSDKLVWKPEDFGQDGTHPSQVGRQKVAELLLDFFKTDPTAKTWFVK